MSLIKSFILVLLVTTFSCGCRNVASTASAQPASGDHPLPCLDTQLHLTLNFPASITPERDSTLRTFNPRTSAIRVYFGVTDITGTISSNLSIAGNDSVLLINAIHPGKGLIKIKAEDGACTFTVRTHADSPRYWAHTINTLATHNRFLIVNDSVAPLYAQASFLNRPLPDKGLRTIDGKDFLPDQLNGKISVLTFWYYGCAACEKLRDPLNTVAEAWEKEIVSFFAVCKDTGYIKNRTPQYQAIRTNRKTNVRDTVFMPEDWAGEHLICGQPLADHLFNYGYPSILILDAQGIVRYCFTGYYPGIEADISAAIRFLWLTRNVLVRD